MASFNKVILIGNLTHDPELRYIPSGQAVTNFSIAVNRAYTLQDGTKKEETSFVRIVVWGKQAENCSEYLSKGRPVLVEGRLQSRSWEAQDGTKRNTIEVVAQRVQFLGTRPPANETGSQGAPQPERKNISPKIETDKEEGEISAGGGEEEVPF